MLGGRALESLAQDLASAVAGMRLRSGDFGKPELVEKPAQEAERLFQGYAKAKPSKEDAYAAARMFLRGERLDAWQRDLIASAVAQPVHEQGGASVLTSKRLPDLLNTYEKEARAGELWRLTWHGLLYSYFSFDPNVLDDEAAHNGCEILRSFLERTWPLVDQQAGATLIPDWVNVLRRESDLLTANPAKSYAEEYLRGDTTATDRLAADLGIPPSSWFWHALVLGAVKRATAEGDAEFRRLIPQLLKLVQSKPGFRDEALEAILIRYHACKGAPEDERLRDYVCQSTVWKNPKLKAAGIATAWNRVPDNVWQMVLGWVNGRNLKDFFDILAARNKADEGRLAFWSQYLKQIAWTRLVFGADTMALQRRSAEVRDLIAREQGAYAQLTGKKEVDAFMMQIGSYLIIEFSKKPNACYVYKVDELPFEPYDRHYSGGTEDLAAGFRLDCAARIVHTPGWAARAAEELMRLGIRPDRHVVQRIESERDSDAQTSFGGTARRSSEQPDMDALRALVGRFRGASMTDTRDLSNSGRLWVDDPLQRAQLAAELQAMGFEWAKGKQLWYFRDR